MTNRLAVITGASSGIGETFARSLAGEGCDLCITGRRVEKLESIANDLRQQFNISVEVIVADLSTDSGIHQVEDWIKTHPRIDLLINNAGFGIRSQFANKPADVYGEMISVHVLAAMRLTSAVLPAMIKEKQGAVINVSSLTAYLPLAGNAVYSGTKSFLNSFSRALSYELKNTGVKVQLLAPGFTYSDFHKRVEYSHLNTYNTVPKFLWMTSEQVVQSSLNALARNRPTCIPGLINKIIVFAGVCGLGGLASAIMARRYKKKDK
jgi:short-subunit dehydrogenase